MNQCASSEKPNTLSLIGLGLSLCLFAFLSWTLSRTKYFAIDEFQYGHAAWMVHRGQVPYRDFFDHHFPLIYQVAAPLFGLEGNGATLMGYLRLAMLPVIAALVLGLFMVRRAARQEALWSTLFMLSSAPLMSRLIEFRPDTLGLALFVLALGVLASPLNPRWRGFWVGALVTLAVWSTQKVMVYGLPFVLAFGLDAWRWLRRKQGLLLGQPLYVVLGAGLALATFPLALFWQAGVEVWYDSCILWPMRHEQQATGFSWTRFFMPILLRSWWQWPFFAAGIVALVKEAWGRDFLLRPQWLLLLALPLSFHSYALQKAPYPYSMMPFLVLCYLVCGVGIVYLGKLLAAQLPKFAVVALALIVFGLLWFQAFDFLLAPNETNHYQRAMMEEASSCLTPEDIVYDNSASLLIQPSLHYYYFTSLFMRVDMAKQLAVEIPRAIEDKGCTYFFLDMRFAGLAPELKRYLLTHFVCRVGELWVYGSGLPAGGEATSFKAIREGKYFIWPAAAVASVTVDGMPVADQVFELSKGDHIFHNGSDRQIHVVWLPADGVVFEPRPPQPDRFSKI